MVSSNKIREDTQNDYTKGDNRYPKDPQQTLHLLDKYEKSSSTAIPSSEATAFAQSSKTEMKGKGWDGSPDYDVNYQKTKNDSTVVRRAIQLVTVLRRRKRMTSLPV